MSSEVVDEPPAFIHSHALCETPHVGAGSRIWAFAHILPGARLGKNCNVCDGVFIENDVIVGDHSTIKCGVQLWDGTRVGNRVFIGPNATFTNDRSPIANVYRAEHLVTHLEDDVSVGANATILPGIRVGRGALIGAGAVVTHDVPPFAIVVGNPAVVEGYRETEKGRAKIAPTKKALTADKLDAAVGSTCDLDVRDCFLERLPNFVDMRGSLLPMELGKGLAFPPARIFSVYGVANRQVRGEHAHRVCRQLLISLSGGLTVVLDDGLRRSEVRLDDPTVGLHLAPMVWGTQYKFDPTAILLVVASHAYDPADYIRDYDEFRGLVR